MHVVHNLSLHFYMLLIIEVETLTELKDEDGILLVQDKPYCNAWKY